MEVLSLFHSPPYTPPLCKFSSPLLLLSVRSDTGVNERKNGPMKRRSTAGNSSLSFPSHVNLPPPSTSSPSSGVRLPTQQHPYLPPRYFHPYTPILDLTFLPSFVLFASPMGVSHIIFNYPDGPTFSERYVARAIRAQRICTEVTSPRPISSLTPPFSLPPTFFFLDIIVYICSSLFQQFFAEVQGGGDGGTISVLS